MHERGHLEIKNFIISLIPILVIMGLLVLAYDSIMNLILLLLNASTFMTLFILLFLIPLLIVFESILELPSRWTIEILADKYAIERTKKGVFSKALKKVYDYHKKYTPFSIGKLRRRYVLHPPIRIRLWVIKQFEKNKQ